MRLGLGSAAAPDASLDELLGAAVRRGLAGVELEEGHGHGLAPARNAADVAATGSPDSIGAGRLLHPEEAAVRAADAGVELVGYRLADRASGSGTAEPLALARFSEALGAPLLVPCDATAGGVQRVVELAASGSRPVAVLPSRDPLQVLDRLPADLPVAWDAHPSVQDLTAAGAALIRAAGPRLRHIRLHGGGPEASGQEGRGIGSLMARLAVLGYAGGIALVPSSRRYRVIWDAWLGRRGGWGCGSRDEDRTLVSLEGVA